jgi:toxin ParE1/3/4
VRVIFTSRAERHIETPYDYIAERDGEVRAEAYITRIAAFCLSLPTFPLRGNQRDDLLPGLRTIGFERRVTIAFVLTDEAVLIEGIFHGGRDVEGAFEDKRQYLNSITRRPYREPKAGVPCMRASMSSGKSRRKRLVLLLVPPSTARGGTAATWNHSVIGEKAISCLGVRPILAN